MKGGRRFWLQHRLLCVVVSCFSVACIGYWSFRGAVDYRTDMHSAIARFKIPLADRPEFVRAAGESGNPALQKGIAEQCLAKYRAYIDDFDIGGALKNWEVTYPGERRPKSRYYTLLEAFRRFENSSGHTIVEVGTTRSFRAVEPGVNQNNPKYFSVNDPSQWDWGAGSFTRLAAECLAHTKPVFIAVDIEPAHLWRSWYVVKEFKFVHHLASSSDIFFQTFPKKVMPLLKSKGIDLLYLDTGDMNPIEFTARLHINEAVAIVRNNLVNPRGFILIDDVYNQGILPGQPCCPDQFEPACPDCIAKFGKARYSIPYFKKHNFTVDVQEYQWLLAPVRHV